MRSKYLVSLIGLHLTLGLAAGTNEVDNDWEAFKNHHKKNYEDGTAEAKHKGHFEKNRDKINKHNAENHEWKMAINEFSDMDPADFNKQRNGAVPPPEHPGNPPKSLSRGRRQATTAAPLPASVDWRNVAGAVQPIKDQGGCGSCWAFSAVSTLESQYFIKYGQNKGLSEQNMVDCVNNGCSSGWMETAWNWIRANNGIDTGVSYPYTASDPRCTTTCSYSAPWWTCTTSCTYGGSTAGFCKYNATNKAATLTGWVRLPAGDENAIKQAIARVGPVSVALDASNLQSYSSGIFSCPVKNGVGHGVVLVGYGTSSDGVDYWIARNSWGSGWGLGGYFLIRRNYNSTCSIADFAMYPTV